MFCYFSKSANVLSSSSSSNNNNIQWYREKHSSTASSPAPAIRREEARAYIYPPIQIPRNFPATTTVESGPRGLYREFLGSLQILPGSTFLLLSPNILLLAHAHCTLWIRKYRFYVYAARAYTLRFVPARSLSLSRSFSLLFGARICGHFRPCSTQYPANGSCVTLDSFRIPFPNRTIPAAIPFAMHPYSKTICYLV